MNTSEQAELRAIIDKQLDNPPLDQQDILRLEQLLEDEQLMEYYLQSMELNAHMRDAVENAELAELANINRNQQKTKPWMAPAMVAAACFIFSAGWFLSQKQALPKTLPLNSRAAVSPTAAPVDNARITGMFGVRWTHPPKSPTDTIHAPEKIIIESGLIELTYQSGVNVIIEGPAHYSISGKNDGILEYGKFVANVPKGAEGFTINYPMGKVVDLGTEFGVDLSPNGELSVGVFKGKVELHPKGHKDIALIEENHALSHSPASSTPIHSIPFIRENYIRQVPSREFSWSIDTDQETETSFDVSHLIWKPGDYRAVIKWMYGKHAVKISHATLWRDGHLITEDRHEGITGVLLTHKTRDNIYNFTIPPEQYKKGQWTIKVKLTPVTKSPPAPVSTQGVLLLEEGLAYQATAKDFIGRWQYRHDGSTWERRVLEGGKIELYANGKLRPGFKKAHWLVKDGVLKVWIPHRNAFEDHLLRDPKTMIFIDEPYRNAVKITE